MAKQTGVVKISGNLDDLTFAKTKNGHLVRKKGKVATKDEIATGKQYARMRENMDEFLCGWALHLFFTGTLKRICSNGRAGKPISVCSKGFGGRKPYSVCVLGSPNLCTASCG